MQFLPDCLAAYATFQRLASVTFNLAAGKYQVVTDKIALHAFTQSFDNARRQLLGIVLNFCLCHQLKHNLLFLVAHAGGQFIAAHAIPLHVSDMITGQSCGILALLANNLDPLPGRPGFCCFGLLRYDDCCDAGFPVDARITEVAHVAGTPAGNSRNIPPEQNPVCLRLLDAFAQLALFFPFVNGRHGASAFGRGGFYHVAAQFTCFGCEGLEVKHDVPPQHGNDMTEYRHILQAFLRGLRVRWRQ
ncbi:hypothetical protein D3C80_1244410 [compost metagenome]